MDRDGLFVAGVRCLPRRRLSRWARRAVDIHSAMAVRRFAAAYGIDLSDAERPLEAYRSIHDLFVRKLRPGARPVDPAPEALVSPVDGRVSQRGACDGPLPQAKGRAYTVDALLAGAEPAETYRAGSFVTVYLAPRDYHRIHAPLEGRVDRWTHVPGDLFPVNEASVTHVDQLFARNERLITHLDTERFGRVAVVKVGATIVGRVRASYAPEITTNVPTVREVRSEAIRPAKDVLRGEEIGVFEMGSTVIVLTERPVRWTVEPGDAVRLGQRLGVAAPDAQAA